MPLFSLHQFCRDLFRKDLNIPLQWVLVIPFVLQTAGAVALVGYLSYRSGQQAVMDLANRWMDETSDRITQKLETYLQTPFLINRLNVDAVQRQHLDPRDGAALELALFDRLQQFDQVTAILFASPEGVVRDVDRTPFPNLAVADPEDPETTRVYPLDAQGRRGTLISTLSGLDVRRDRPWYKRAVETGQPGWNPIFLYDASSIPVLNASQPVYDPITQQLLGVFAVHVRLDSLSQFLNRLTLSQAGQIIILDAQGRLVATSTLEPSSRLGDSTQDLQISIQDSQDKLTRSLGQMLRDRTHDFTALSSHEHFQFTYQGERQFVQIVPFQDAHGLAWQIVTVTPESAFMTDIQRNTQTTVVLCLLTLGFSMGAGWAIARRLTQRIRQLERASQALAAGDLTQQMPANSVIREAQVIAQAFNQMAAQLQHLFQDQVALEATRQSEARFQQLAAAVPGMIYTYTQWPDGSYGFDYVSSAIRDILELEPEQALADVHTVLDQIHPDDRLLYAAAIARHDVTLEPFHFQFRNITPSGQMKWLEINSRPFRNSDGRITWHGILLDMSDRQQLELALQASTAKLNDILNGAYLASITSLHVFPDGDWEYLYQSPGCEALFGYTVSEIMGNKDLWMSQVFAADRDTTIYPLLEEIFRGASKTVEFRFHHKDGSLRWISSTITSRYDEANQCWVVTGVSTDITQGKQAENALRTSEERLRMALEAAQMGNWDWNLETQQMVFSESLERMVGLQPGGFDGRFETAIAIIHPEDRHWVSDAITRSLEQSESYNVECRFVKTDGTVRWALCKGNVLRDAAGRAVRMVGVNVDITDRKLAEISLNQALQELTDHIETSPLATIHWDQDCRVKFWSSQAERIFGWTADEVIGKTNHDWPFIFEEDREVVNQVLAELRQGKNMVRQNRNYRKDGSIIYCEWYNSIRLDEQGNLLSIVSLVQDVSDRHRGEAALAEEIQQRKTLFDTSVDGIVVLNQDRDVVEANASFLKMTGYSLEELLTLNVSHLDTQWSHEDLEQMAKNQELYDRTFETRHRRKDGSIYDVEVSSNRINWQGQPMHFCICRDISDRKQAETALRRSEAALAQAQRVARMGNWEFHLASQRVTGSKELFLMFGLDPEGAELSHVDFWWDRIHPEDRAKLEQCTKQAIAHGTPFTIDYRAVLPDGSIRHLEGRGEVEYDSQGQIICLYGTAQDITERKQFEQELERAKDAAEIANRAKSAFLSTISHELRTPLNVILGFTQLMTQDTTLSADHQDYIRLIHKNGSHLLQLINEVLNLSRIEAGKLSLDPKPMDLFGFLESIGSSFRQQAQKRRLQFHLHIDPRVPRCIIADAQKIQQILLNLLGNAVKFTQTGHITLRVTMEEEYRDQEDEPPSPHLPLVLMFAVEDTGIGIPPEDQQRIFDAFTQVVEGHDAQEGSGLGLTISRRLAQLMGGDITVRSTLGIGSTFEVRIHVQPAIEPLALMDESNHRIIGVIPSPSPYRMLVVDDEADNRFLLQLFLKSLGFTVETVARGQDAIQMWKHWQPHLIWMDLRMPAPDGYRVTQQIRQEEQQLQDQGGEVAEGRPCPCIIVALTAQASPEDCDRALAAGCDGYLSKPFQIERVLQLITQYLNVQYRYANDAASSEVISQPSLAAGQLAIMPQEWVLELHQAALSCEQRAVQSLIQQIQPDHGALASQLDQLAHNFDFATILQLAQDYLESL